MGTEMLAGLKHLTEAVADSLESLKQEVEPLLFGTQSESLDVNVQFFFLLDKLHDLSKEIGKLYNVHENELCSRINKALTVMDVESMVKEFDGNHYTLKPDNKTFISCRADKKPELLAWLRTHPVGRELIKEDVHAKSLESFIKNEVIGKGAIPPAGIISMHMTETISMRKKPQ